MHPPAVLVSRKDLNALRRVESRLLMKREGYIYDKMSCWDNIVEAEYTATKRKKNHGVIKHKKRFMEDLVNLQQGVIDGTIHPGPYTHMTRMSGQGKVRDIAKQKFYPDHLYNQLLVIASTPRIEKSLIRHTYASRIGYGQTKAALQIRKWLRKDPVGTLWVVKFDFVKFYDNIIHDNLRKEYSRLFRDERFINSIMEVYDTYRETGIPIGSKPSQQSGNLALQSLDRYIKETLRVRYYLRYLDDFVIFCRTKAEANRMTKRIVAFASSKIGMKMHTPRIFPVSEGLDFLGYVFYPGGQMFWRKSDKIKWIKNRSRVTNKKRLRELDCSAWGMLKHGNKHCKRLFIMNTGIDFKAFGLKKPEQKDKDGVKFIDGGMLNTPLVKEKKIIIDDWTQEFSTKYGTGRRALHVIMGSISGKLIIHALPMRTIISLFEENDVTKFETYIIDTGDKKYEFDVNRTKILEVKNRPVENSDNGEVIFSDTKEPIK